MKAGMSGNFCRVWACSQSRHMHDWKRAFAFQDRYAACFIVNFKAEEQVAKLDGLKGKIHFQERTDDNKSLHRKAIKVGRDT